MPANYDFRCPNAHTFEAISHYAITGVQPVDCPDCGESAAMIWLKAPGLKSDEAPPADRVAAARTGMIFSKGHTDPVEPFTGSTRTELERWEEKNNCTPVSADELTRIGQKKFKPSEDPATRKLVEETAIKTFEMAEAGKLQELYQEQALDAEEKELLTGAASESPEAAAVLEESNAAH